MILEKKAGSGAHARGDGALIAMVLQWLRAAGVLEVSCLDLLKDQYAIFIIKRIFT